ncbi:MAG: ThuA domain-containing protein [Saccharofermentanales bacterium]
MIRVTVWNEHRMQDTKEIIKVHPEGIHKTIESFLKQDSSLIVRTAVLDDPEQGLSDEILDNTDVLIWWGHCCHDKLDDVNADKVAKAVLKGMGFIPLHSSHLSKPFTRLMGTSCSLKWRDNDSERLWTILPAHPVAKGVPEYIELDSEEMYGERFDIPDPDELVFLGWFSGGELFRSGCLWSRGYGKIFYFQPGHETNPSYHNEHIQRIIINAVHYVSPAVRIDEIVCPQIEISYEERKRLRNLHN